MKKLAAEEVAGFADLNKAAAKMDGVFVYVPGKGEAADEAPIAVMHGAARAIEPDRGGGKIGIFTLMTDSPDYEMVAAQVRVPAVIALARGGGMGAAWGGITKAKLVKAYATASKACGCGCSGGCGDGDGCCG